MLHELGEVRTRGMVDLGTCFVSLLSRLVVATEELTVDLDVCTVSERKSLFFGGY